MMREKAQRNQIPETIGWFRKKKNENDKVYMKALTFEDMKQQQKQTTNYFCLKRSRSIR